VFRAAGNGSNYRVFTTVHDEARINSRRKNLRDAANVKGKMGLAFNMLLC
jgi:hypothetical protein